MIHVHRAGPKVTSEMAIEFVRSVRSQKLMAFKCDRRLYLTRDKSRVVEEGDKTCGWLFATLGGQITAADAAAYGLEWRDGKIILPGREPKAAKKAEDKALKRGGDKAASAPPPDRKKPPAPPAPPPRSP